jgi:membrane protease YdiL (CAAX protease family)
MSLPLSEINWVNLGLSYLFLLVINVLVFSMGEEIGWRGFLLPRLLHLGKVKAYLLTGLIWAIWHYPLIFLTDLYASEGNRLMQTLLFTLTVLGISLVIGHIWQSKQSVWVASMFHSSHNVAWQLLDGLTVKNEAVTYLAGESGLIPLAIYLLVGFILAKSDKKH